jgi:hypothetical protein
MIFFKNKFSVLTLTVIFLIPVLSASAFVGPGIQGPGSGGGAFTMDANLNLGFGTSAGTPGNGAFSKVLRIGGSDKPGISLYGTGGHDYVWNSMSTGYLSLFDATANASRLSVDASGTVWFAGNVNTSSSFVGNFSGALSAGNIQPGVFGSIAGTGSYSFPSSFKLGVGTSSNSGLPQALSVYGNGYFSGGVSVGTTDSSYPVEIYNNTDDSTAGLRIRAGIVASNVALQVGSASSIKFTIQSNGNVGVGAGATAPTILLALGDPDTGFKWVSDGNFSLYINNVSLADFGPSGMQVNGTSTLSGNVVLGDVGKNISFSGAALTDLNMNSKNITGVDKITAATFDPLYDIGGAKYSTYLPAIAGGVKEEYVGKGNFVINGNSLKLNGNLLYYVINFDDIKKGSDLWVWRNVVDFNKDNVEVLATPVGIPIPIAYEIEGNEIIFTISSNQLQSISNNYDKLPANIEFSYRLIGKRFDWQKWPTYAKDQSESTDLIIKQ